MALAGIDMGNILDAVGGEIKGLTSAMGFASESAGMAEPRDPLGAYQQPQSRRDPFANLSYGQDALGGFQLGQIKDPFANIRYEGDPLRGFSSQQRDPLGGFVSGVRDNFGMFSQALQNQAFGDQQRAEEKRQTQVDPKRPITSVPGGGYDYSGPATAEDNQGVTGAQIDQFIASKFANSPMAGQGQYILDTANKYGISALMLIGISWKESGMGTNVGRGNIFGITDPSRDTGSGVRQFMQYGSTQEEIEAGARLLSSSTYKGKSAAEQMGAWYVGPQKFAAEGLNATDGAGNGTVGQYLENFIAPTYAAFGKAFNPAQKPTQRAPQGGGAPITADGYAFPVVGYGSPRVELHWGSEKGGADLFAPIGAPVVSLGNGKVIDAGTNSLGGNTVTIQLDNGLTVYMAHLRDAPLVQAGQRVNAGQQLGYVGDTGNAKGTSPHLHIGIGKSIVNGGGPTGGLGSDFDAYAWLNAILGQTRSKGAAPAAGGETHAH